MQQELGKESTDYDEQHNNDQKSTTNLPNLPISMPQWPQQLPQPFPQRFWRDIEQMAKNNSVVILPQEKSAQSRCFGLPLWGTAIASHTWNVCNGLIPYRDPNLLVCWGNGMSSEGRNPAISDSPSSRNPFAFVIKKWVLWDESTSVLLMMQYAVAILTQHFV